MIASPFHPARWSWVLLIASGCTIHAQTGRVERPRQSPERPVHAPRSEETTAPKTAEASPEPEPEPAVDQPASEADTPARAAGDTHSPQPHRRAARRVAREVDRGTTREGSETRDSSSPSDPAEGQPRPKVRQPTRTHSIAERTRAREQPKAAETDPGPRQVGQRVAPERPTRAQPGAPRRVGGPTVLDRPAPAATPQPASDSPVTPVARPRAGRTGSPRVIQLEPRKPTRTRTTPGDKARVEGVIESEREQREGRAAAQRDDRKRVEKMVEPGEPAPGRRTERLRAEDSEE